MCYGVQPVGGEFLQKKAMVFSEARAVAAGCARMCGSYAPAQQTAAALLVFSDTTRPLGTNSCPHAFLRASYSYRRPRAECILPPVKLDLPVEVATEVSVGGPCSSSSVCSYVCRAQQTPAGALITSPQQLLSSYQPSATTRSLTNWMCLGRCFTVVVQLGKMYV